ncbi:MAG: glutamate-5-semialdehyde dehydrogenase [Patescibacteria group bacterium]|nr:glutamate-5-semialdehyde dehydrogenase [Patescibacteria group bacterium]
MTKKQLFKLLLKAKKAQSQLAFSSLSERNKILTLVQENLKKNLVRLIKGNKKDLKKLNPDDPKYDRLLLNEKRILSLIENINEIIKLDDPLGKILEERKLKSGLSLQKISVPFGVIGVIYESRPNVTCDVSAICLKSGNAVVLKGGEEAENSNKILAELFKSALSKAGFSNDLILRIPEKERGLVSEVLKADKFIDVIIPRGGKGLIDFVKKNSLVPVIETGAGVCHIYVDEFANIDMAVRIVVNAKVSRPSVCNALDTLVVDVKILKPLLQKLAKELRKYEVEVFADVESYKILRKLEYPFLKKAKKSHFGFEFLSLKMAVKSVKNLSQAIDFVNFHTTKHSEAIITENKENAEKFLREVDAACIYHNASTRFSDGAEFGMGGEIGISTQKLHARGPMGLKEVTTYKWLIRGEGQIRI